MCYRFLIAFRIVRAGPWRALALYKRCPANLQLASDMPYLGRGATPFVAFHRRFGKAGASTQRFQNTGPSRLVTNHEREAKFKLDVRPLAAFSISAYDWSMICNRPRGGSDEIAVNGYVLRGSNFGYCLLWAATSKQYPRLVQHWSECFGSTASRRHAQRSTLYPDFRSRGRDNHPYSHLRRWLPYSALHWQCFTFSLDWPQQRPLS